MNIDIYENSFSNCIVFSIHEDHPIMSFTVSKDGRLGLLNIATQVQVNIDWRHRKTACIRILISRKNFKWSPSNSFRLNTNFRFLMNCPDEY